MLPGHLQLLLLLQLAMWQSMLETLCGLQLPAAQDSNQVTNVCVGTEWYRFPSAFFLPSPSYRLAFIPSSFSGLLPTDFNMQKVCARLCASPLQCQAHGYIHVH